MLDPATIDPFSLPAVARQERNKLPHGAALYFVLSNDKTVLYVGRSAALYGRWVAHHLLEPLRNRGGVRIAWMVVSDPALLPPWEALCINHFHPRMNREIVERDRRQRAPKNPPKCFSIPAGVAGDDLWKAVKIQAAREQLTISGWIIKTLREKLDRDAKKK